MDIHDRDEDEWAWLARLAQELGEAAPDRTEIGAMLRLSRDVARGVERKMAPLSTFVAGMHVGRRVAEGASRGEALREVLEAGTALVPERPDDGGHREEREEP